MSPDTITPAPVHPSIGAAHKCARFAVDDLARAMDGEDPANLSEAVRYLETALRLIRQYALTLDAV